jgi:hypothetical protein
MSATLSACDHLRPAIHFPLIYFDHAADVHLSAYN